MKYYDSIKNNRTAILMGILIISLLGNYYLISENRNYKRTNKIVAGDQYIAFFSSLSDYAESLEYLEDHKAEHNDIEREIKKVQEQVNSLINYARSYSMLSPKQEGQLPAILWQIAMDANGFYNRYLTEENVIKYNAGRISEFSSAIDEIVELESSIRIKAARTKEGFIEKDMADILYQKMKKIMEISGLYDEVELFLP